VKVLKIDDVTVYITVCLKIDKLNDLQHTLILSGLPSISFSQVMMPKLMPGQIVIAAFVENNYSIYVLDSQFVPFQIVGTRDFLIDASFYKDLTIDYKRTIFEIQFIFKQIFSELTLQEMDDYKYLSEWERKIKETIIPEKYNFNEMILYCQESLIQLPDNNVNKKMYEKLQTIKRPRKKYLSEQYINWDNYNIKNQTTTTAID